MLRSVLRVIHYLLCTSMHDTGVTLAAAKATWALNQNLTRRHKYTIWHAAVSTLAPHTRQALVTVAFLGRAYDRSDLDTERTVSEIHRPTAVCHSDCSWSLRPRSTML